MNRFSRVVLLLTITAVLGAPAPSSAWPIPDTGQTECYNSFQGIPCPQPDEDFYGQDGSYLINPPSYTKLDANGKDLPDSATSWIMVRDNVTRLIWEVKTDDESIHDRDNRYSWWDAEDIFIAELNNANFGGYSDWRMPTIKELASITNLAKDNPSINIIFFPNTYSYIYWTATATTDPGYAWYIDFDGGSDYYIKMTNNYYTRAVRGKQSDSSDIFMDNGDGTITDTFTGLMWQKEQTDKKTWQTALACCEQLVLGEYDDWRLPNREELRSIVDYTKYHPPINTRYFNDIKCNIYWYCDWWSSTTWIDDYYRAWATNFYDGCSSDVPNKNETQFIRAVRGGQVQVLDHLIILTPGQSEKWFYGEQKTITWNTQGIAGNVRLSISRQGGKVGTFESIVATTENDGSYAWTVTGPISVNCVLKIEPLSDMIRATSQGFFSIILSRCPQCNGDPVLLQGVTFEAGLGCECKASTLIRIGPDVTIKKGANITFTAPKIEVTPGAKIEPGAVVNMRQE